MMINYNNQSLASLIFAFTSILRMSTKVLHGYLQQPSLLGTSESTLPVVTDKRNEAEICNKAQPFPPGLGSHTLDHFHLRASLTD